MASEGKWVMAEGKGRGVRERKEDERLKKGKIGGRKGKGKVMGGYKG